MKIGMQAWGSQGDIRPMLALAAGLVRAGHEVTMVITAIVEESYQPVADRFGIKLIEVPNPLRLPNDQVASIWHRAFTSRSPVFQAKQLLNYGLVPTASPVYKAVLDLCQNSDFLICYFFTFAPMDAAEKAGKPYVTVNIAPNCMPSRAVPPPSPVVLGRWSYPLFWWATEKFVNGIFLPAMNDLRRQEGLSKRSNVMRKTWQSPFLNLLAVSPSICAHPPDWPSKTKICGFLNLPKGNQQFTLSEKLADFIDQGEAPVYFTFGSMMMDEEKYVAQIVSVWRLATKKLGERAIYQLPSNFIEQYQSSKDELFVSESPYDRIFPKCRVVVHHGGAGTTQACLLAGVPSVVVAHIADQFFWGAELTRLGVSSNYLTRRDLNGKKLAKLVRETQNLPEARSKAAAISQRMSSEDGVGKAVTEIEKWWAKTKSKDYM